MRKFAFIVRKLSSSLLPKFYGSLSGHITTTALLQVMDNLYRASEMSEMSAVLLLDQSAAYDLLDHDIFLEKLRIYGFHEKSVLWFKSYLVG